MTTDDSDAYGCAAAQADGFNAIPGATKQYPPDIELEPVHLDIVLALDLVAESAAGSVTHTVEARHAGPRALALHAVALDIRQVADADGRMLSWSYDGQRVDVLWAEPFAAGERRRLAIDYRVDRPTAGLYFNRPTEAYPEEPWFAATDHETERARHWLPTVDQPAVRPRLDFHLTADARFTILANGSLVDEISNADGTKTAHWRLDFPCPSYLTCFVVGDLVKADDGDFEGRPIAYFATPPFSADDLRRSFDRTKPMMAWMQAKFGLAFPFAKYYQFCLPRVGGAMENISLVSWDDVAVLDETSAREATRGIDATNVHEMAHSYFGDAVVCRDYAHAWLKESWAVYTEQLWFEDTFGEDEAGYEFWTNAQSYFNEADNRYQRPIVTREFISSWQMYDRHLYPGGACRLHTLRRLIGDEAFLGGTSDYLKRYAGKVVETDDFRHVIEERSGRSLGKFFDQWFHTAGYPDVKVSFAYDAKREEGTFRIEQAQVGAKGEGPLFELDTAVGWVLDGTLHTWPVRLTQAIQNVTVKLPRDPEQVRFDPLMQVLAKLTFNPGDTKLRRQLTQAGDVIGRIHAGYSLAKSGVRANVEAVRDAFRNEPFWGVRAEWAEALGDAGNQAAVEALAELIATEQDDRVLAPLMRAIGEYRDPVVVPAVSARLDAGLPYRAASAACEALGEQREEAPFEYLAQLASIPSPYGIVQSGALRALAATRRAEALPLLQARVGYGNTSNRARPAAVAALASLARTLDKYQREPVVAQLSDLLRDPIPRIRQTALFGLQTLGASSAIPAIAAYGAPLANQEKLRADEVIAAIRKRDGDPVPALEKQIGELRDQLRKVEDTVAKLNAQVNPGGTSAAKGKGKKRSGKKK